MKSTIYTKKGFLEPCIYDLTSKKGGGGAFLVNASSWSTWFVSLFQDALSSAVADNHAYYFLTVCSMQFSIQACPDLPLVMTFLFIWWLTSVSMLELNHLQLH